MRIDKVAHRKIVTKDFQLLVNRHVKIGYTKEQLIELLKKSFGEILEASGERTRLTFPFELHESHLKRGYVFYFKCPLCTRRAQWLYYLSDTAACRICHHLTYAKQTRREREINRLIWNHTLYELYATSGNLVMMRKALEANFIRENIQKDASDYWEVLRSKLMRSGLTNVL